jgi:integrase
VIQYRNAEKRTRRYTLGGFPPLSPAEAREEATALLVEVAQGGDPAESKTERTHAPTVADLADRYWADHAEKNKPATRQANRRMLDREILPVFGTRKVTAVTDSDVSRWHASFGDRPIMGNRCLFLLSTLFGLAERWNLRERNTNPARYVERFKEQHRTRHLDDLERARLLKTLDEFDQKPPHPHDRIKVAAVRLLLLTGCRRNEVLSLKWEDVNLDRGVLLLRTSKTGERPVLLNAPALDVLRTLEANRRAACPWVFPSPSKPSEHLREFRKTWDRIKAKAQLKDFRLHDLRHTLASEGLREGMSLPAIGALLGHSKPTTTDRYSHWLEDSRREHSERIGRRLTAVPPTE